MGQVYEGRQLGLDRRVAIKVLRPRVKASQAARRRFEREARAMARIESDHVAVIFDFGVGPEEQPYLVMEYLEGHDLRALLKEQSSLPAPRATRLIHDACRGLTAAHEQGVIHRDLKPENLFAVVRDGRELCKVLDFGLAKFLLVNRAHHSTQAGVPLGTLHYMSPEQARGDTDIDERADVYGCAAVLYELITGRRPHSAESDHGLLYKIIHESPKRADLVSAYVPAGLADIVQLGLAHDRASRPTSVRALADLLQPFISGDARVAAAPRAHRAETAPDAESTLGWVPTAVGVTRAGPNTKRKRGRELGAIAAGMLVGSVATWWFMPAPVTAKLAPGGASPARHAEPGARTENTSSPALVAGMTDRETAPTSDPDPSTEAPLSRPLSPSATKGLRPMASGTPTSRATSFERHNPYE
jgi:serine/threonine-protein kinase